EEELKLGLAREALAIEQRTLVRTLTYRQIQVSNEHVEILKQFCVNELKGFIAYVSNNEKLDAVGKISHGLHDKLLAYALVENIQYKTYLNYLDQAILFGFYNENPEWLIIFIRMKILNLIFYP